jgi:hypothetical protein
MPEFKYRKGNIVARAWSAPRLRIFALSGIGDDKAIAGPNEYDRFEEAELLRPRILYRVLREMKIYEG